MAGEEVVLVIGLLNVIIKEVMVYVVNQSLKASQVEE